MQNNFPKMPIILSIVFFIFSCSVFLYFYKIINNNNSVSQIREIEWQSEALRRSEIRTLENSVKTVEDEKKQLEAHFAQSSDIVPFLDNVEKLAVAAGTRAVITSVDILENHNGLLVSMKASGTFNDIYKFLTLLENSAYELEFLSADIKKETGLWNAIFTIKLLSFID